MEAIAEGLNLLPGDLGLSRFEDELSAQWPQCLDGSERAFRVISAFWRLVEQAAADVSSRLVLLDVGPNPGAINRAALISADCVVVPLSDPERLHLPPGAMLPVGYVVLQNAVRLDRPVQAYERWIARIPGVYRIAVLGEDEAPSISVAAAPYCLALVKHYRSLMPMAQEARKPMFSLRPADGAIGSHADAVRTAYKDFRELALEIAQRTRLPVE